MKNIEKEYWEAFLETLENKPHEPIIEVSIAGNSEIADRLLYLFLSGKKTASSGLVKDYELAGDDLPRVGDYWMILNTLGKPKCIVKTVRVEFFKFCKVTEGVAKAEGEGDMSIEYWKNGHRKFFEPYLKDWQITDLDNEQVVTEFFEVVYK